MVRRWLGAFVAAVVVLAIPAPASAFDQPRTLIRFAAAVWPLDDGCVERSAVVYSSSTTSSGQEPDTGPESFFNLSLSQTCDDPTVSRPILDLSAELPTGGHLLVRGDLTGGALRVTMPLSCAAYAPGACDQAPYNAATVTVDLRWSTPGDVQTGTTCRYRYGDATGAIELGVVNLLLDPRGRPVPADPTETNVGRCVE